MIGAEVAAAGIYGAIKAVTEKPTSYVVHGATIQCSCGLRLSNIVVQLSHGEFIHNMPQLNIGDSKPNENILSFGGCTSPENESVQKAAEKIMKEVQEREKGFMDHVMDFFCKNPKEEVNEDFVKKCAGECIPIIKIEWDGGKEDVLVEDKMALLTTCTLSCIYGGNITIIDNGQEQAQDAMESTMSSLNENNEIVIGKLDLVNDFFNVNKLSKEHREIISLSNNVANNDVKQWTVLEAAKWQAEKHLLGSENVIEDFKNNWIKGERDIIKQASKRYDIPDYLLAGTLRVEVGGSPLCEDTVVYNLRKYSPNKLKEIVPQIRTDKDKTSIGNASIQIRRAAESLGYNEPLTEEQRNQIYDSLMDSKQSIFICAKHLSDLRDVDFKGIKAKDLTEEDVKVIGSRYNIGPDPEKKAIVTQYGEQITSRKKLLRELLDE